MEYDFPIKIFLQVKEELQQERHQLEEDKAAWRQVRHSLNKEDATQLDEQFRDCFIAMRIQLLENCLNSLTNLVRKGASARLLGNDELGTKNLAMVISGIDKIYEKAHLDIITQIIRITIIADADLKSQKSYFGNGGMISIEWVMLYLSKGITNSCYLHHIDQYNCCYRIFPWLPVMHGDKDFETFLLNLQVYPETAELQQRTIFRMLSQGYFPFQDEAACFKRLAIIHHKWMTLLLPYEIEYDGEFTAAIGKNIINSFTSSNATRKQFRVFFSQRPHWLLRSIVTIAPEIIFDLTRRNEQDLLIPFLKHFKRELADNGHRLLSYAMTTRGVVENTILLIRNANL